MFFTFLVKHSFASPFLFEKNFFVFYLLGFQVNSSEYLKNIILSRFFVINNENTLFRVVIPFIFTCKNDITILNYTYGSFITSRLILFPWKLSIWSDHSSNSKFLQDHSSFWISDALRKQCKRDLKPSSDFFKVIILKRQQSKQRALIHSFQWVNFF
jgi:hypothetical protein